VLGTDKLRLACKSHQQVLIDLTKEREEQVFITLKAADEIHPCHGDKVAS